MEQSLGQSDQAQSQLSTERTVEDCVDNPDNSCSSDSGSESDSSSDSHEPQFAIREANFEPGQLKIKIATTNRVKKPAQDGRDMHDSSRRGIKLTIKSQNPDEPDGSTPTTKESAPNTSSVDSTETVKKVRTVVVQ